MEQQEIALIGKVSASMTHEMKNVLAIIKESNGLMKDILALCGKASFPHQEKFSNATAKIDKHLGRGVEMMTRFNKFAHSMDEPRGWVEINELMDQVAFLMQRFARQRQVELLAQSIDKSPSVYTNPIRLLLALLACVDQCLGQIDEKGSIVICSEIIDDQVAFHFVLEQGLEKPFEAASDLGDQATLGEALQALGGELQQLKKPGRLGWSLFIPLQKE
jgi:C4-dicarboxylate-specific signal transduction histidine kinase